jgi:hypothetical protein
MNNEEKSRGTNSLNPIIIITIIMEAVTSHVLQVTQEIIHTSKLLQGVMIMVEAEVEIHGKAWQASSLDNKNKDHYV